MAIFSLITVREGSRGLKSKCTREIDGKAIFKYTIEYSMSLNHTIGELFTVVSSDSEIIRRYCSENDICFLKRSPRLASDDTRIEDVIYDAYHKIGRDFDYISLLYGNIPTRYPEEFLKAYNFLVANNDYDCVLSMQNVEKFNPAWMFALAQDILPVKKEEGYRRQDLKQFMVHDGHTILFRTEHFLEFMNGNSKIDVMYEAFGNEIKPMLNDKVIIDIDTEKDLKLAEAVLCSRNAEGGEISNSYLKIANRKIGNNEPCFIIAEAGVNHNGDVNLAKKLVDAAKEAGADAVKFQTFKAEEVVSKDAEKAQYQKETTGAEESQFEMIKKLELSREDFEELFAYAQRKGIIFLSSPFDNGSVDLLHGLGILAFKIGSGEITNLPLLKHIARKKKPIILSTGMSTLGEIEDALEVIRKEGAKEIVLLHCVSCYPAKIEDMNLKAIETLKHAFKLPVGLSDHTTAITIPVAAVALGTCVIEKHFTLDKNLLGPDHRASLEPQELNQMIKAIRDIEKAMGDGIKRLTVEEEENKRAARRSIVAKVDIPQGTFITEEMLGVKRPSTGINPKHIDMIAGSLSTRHIRKDELIGWNDFSMNGG